MNLDRPHKARKRFGQNFLTDHSIIENIVAGLHIEQGDHFVEIGPGKGALTEVLLMSGVQLDIIELDRDLVELLKEKFKAQTNIRIFSADALQFDFSELQESDTKLRVIGNLPYNISTPLLFYLFEKFTCIKDMHFMLQKEVVDRICADPGSKRYGRLSVMSQYYCSVESLFEVAPECFTPTPKVISAVVKLIPHSRPPVQVKSVTSLNKVVKQAFSQRRKTVRNSLKSLISEENIRALSIDPGLRAESISLNDFAKLSNSLGLDIK
jgi:16S rRNA (adenine1518-N6/adenine1519-N6)-dimethyltransferase